MATSDDHLGRLTRAAERIANALEQLVRAAYDAGQQPRLTVARSSTDSGGMTAVNLSTDGKLNVHLQNRGEADTTLVEPSVKLGQSCFAGGIVERDGQVQQSGPVAASTMGPGVIVQFDLGPTAHVLAGLPLTVTLPHRPGRFPGLTALIVEMEPSGEVGGRAGWRERTSDEVPYSDAAA